MHDPRAVELAQSVLQQVEGFVETRLRLLDQLRDLSGNVGDGVEERLGGRLDVVDPLLDLPLNVFDQIHDGLENRDGRPGQDLLDKADKVASGVLGQLDRQLFRPNRGLA